MLRKESQKSRKNERMRAAERMSEEVEKDEKRRREGVKHAAAQRRNLDSELFTNNLTNTTCSMVQFEAR